MNIYDLEKTAVPGQVTAKSNPEWPFGVNVTGTTKSVPDTELFLWGRSTAATFSTRHNTRDDIYNFHPVNAEIDAEIAFTVHCRNHFMKALAELRRLADNQAGLSDEQLTDIARVDLSLLDDLERVK